MSFVGPAAGDHVHVSQFEHCPALNTLHWMLCDGGLAPSLSVEALGRADPGLHPCSTEDLTLVAQVGEVSRDWGLWVSQP